MVSGELVWCYTVISTGNWRVHQTTWISSSSTSPLWRDDDIFDLLRPAASLSLGQELHLAEGTSQSLEQQFRTIFQPICDSTRSHCCHLDKNWNSICLSHECTWGILFKSRYTNVCIIIIRQQKQQCLHLPDLTFYLPTRPLTRPSKQNTPDRMTYLTLVQILQLPLRAHASLTLDSACHASAYSTSANNFVCQLLTLPSVTQGGCHIEATPSTSSKLHLQTASVAPIGIARGCIGCMCTPGEKNNFFGVIYRDKL